MQIFSVVPSLNLTFLAPVQWQPLLHPQRALNGTIAFLLMNPLAIISSFFSANTMLALVMPFTCLPKKAVSLLLERVSDCSLTVAKLHAFCVTFRKKSETPRLE
jgi:hypothetical protein